MYWINSITILQYHKIKLKILKNCFIYIENLYEKCNENTNYIETQILANDNEDNLKTQLGNIINKIHKKAPLDRDDKSILRTLSVQMSIRNPYSVKAVEEKLVLCQEKGLIK